MTIEITENQKEIIENALLRLNTIYENKSEHAYKELEYEESASYLKYAADVYLAYLIIKKQ